jgi:hypothetical protein
VGGEILLGMAFGFVQNSFATSLTSNLTLAGCRRMDAGVVPGLLPSAARVTAIRTKAL